MRFQLQKYEKYLKSKNDLKRPIEAFNKEFLVILRFYLKASEKIISSFEQGKIVSGSTSAGQKSSGSRVQPRTIFLPSGSSESPTPASARSARVVRYGWDGMG